MCLLFLMWELKDKLDFTLEALHLNHCLRGADADGDQEFVRENCEKLGVGLKIVRADVKGYATENGLSLEEAGRILRYKAFRESSPDRIAVAHHANDSAETVLFNLIRGTGLKGLSGIRPVSGDVIRPLIYFTREETESYCRERGIGFREDATNKDVSYDRNRIRLNILPEAERINPAAVRHIIEAAEKTRVVGDFIESEAKGLFAEVADLSFLPQKVIIDAEKLSEAHPCLIEAVIKRSLAILSGSEKDLTGTHIKEVEALINAQSGKSVNLPYGLSVRKSFGSLVFSKIKESPGEYPALPFIVDEGKETELHLPDGSRAKGVVTEKRSDIPNLRYTKWLDYDKIKGRAVWRTRRDGDRISIRGGTKKLKDLFIEEKIPAGERDSYYFLAVDDQAVWVPGLRIGESFKVTEETGKVLEVSLFPAEEEP